MSQEMDNTNISVDNLIDNHLFFRKKENLKLFKQKKTKKIRIYDDFSKYYMNKKQAS